MVDAWRFTNSKRKQYTWTNYQQTQQSRIDRIYVPNNWTPKSYVSGIIPFAWSDHDIVRTKITIPDTITRGPGTWKLNTSLLHDQQYKKTIKNFYQTWILKKRFFKDLQQWWDIGKLHVQALTRNYSHHKNLQNRETLGNAEKILKFQQNQTQPNTALMQRGCLGIS